jgi:hypothetical protein
MAEFEIVKPEEVPAGRHGGGRLPLELSLVLERGETVFVPGLRRNPMPTRTSYLAVRGFAVHSRRGERNGTAGIYLWAERPDTEAVKSA